MFPRKRSDTKVSTIEKQYRIDLHARDDMALRTLLSQRGFESLTQLLEAHSGRLTYHARRRRVFLSFHYEDRTQVSGFRLMVSNPNVAVELYDLGLTEAVNSNRIPYIKQVIGEKIARCEVVLCLIGHGTAWRDFVDWELRTAVELGKGICGVRLKASRGRTPPILSEVGASIAPWNVPDIIPVIEQAAARRS